MHSDSPNSLSPANEQGRRFQLARFGYTADHERRGSVSIDAEWAILKGDFATLKRPRVPDLHDLPDSARQLAEDYIAHRQQLDRLMEACDAAHLVIRDRGADAALVERYADARDAYEDAVETFGERRIELETALGH